MNFATQRFNTPNPQCYIPEHYMWYESTWEFYYYYPGGASLPLLYGPPSKSWLDVHEHDEIIANFIYDPR